MPGVFCATITFSFFPTYLICCSFFSRLLHPSPQIINPRPTSDDNTAEGRGRINRITNSYS